VDAIERTVRLIRSKGVGVWFVTQVPGDVAESVLAQLGSRIQHALRAFTPKDAKALKAAVSTFPTTPGLDLEELLPSLGIGEAAVSVLDEHGVPTQVAHAKIDAPKGRMGPADDLSGASSPLMARYGTRLEAESAREVLARRLPEPTVEPPPELPKPRRRARHQAPDPVETLEREVIRGVFGMLRKRL
jgi:hypothetical protein